MLNDFGDTSPFRKLQRKCNMLNLLWCCRSFLKSSQLNFNKQMLKTNQFLRSRPKTTCHAHVIAVVFPSIKIKMLHALSMCCYSLP